MSLSQEPLVGTLEKSLFASLATVAHLVEDLLSWPISKVVGKAANTLDSFLAAFAQGGLLPG